MKKLLLTLLTVVCTVSAWAYTLPTSTMDLKTITAATIGKWAVQKAYYLEENYLLVSSLEAAKSANADNAKGQTWITQANGTNNGNSSVTSNWTAQTPFKGVTAYTTQAYQTLQKNRNVTFRVANCKSVSVLGKNHSSGKITVSAYLITDGTAETTASVYATQTGTNVQVWTLDLVDDKEYVIDITASGTSNSQVYEVAFERNVVADTRLEPQLSLSATEFTAFAGDIEFEEPTVTSAGGYTGSYTYSSDNPSVASVNVETGNVTIGTAGKAIITVSVPEGDANYKSRSVTYTITVKKVVPVGATFYETFDQFNGQGGNDGIWSNINTTTQLGEFDNEGWTTEGTVSSGKECASIRKMNSTTKSGLTTPEIGVAGNGNVTFEAQAWGTDTSDFYVDIVGGGKFTAITGVALSNNNTTAKVSLSKSSKWDEFDLSFTGLTTSSKFRFYMAADKRGFLDQVAVFITSTDITISNAGYATYYNDALAVTLPTGIEGYVWDNGLVKVYDAATSENVIPAKEPVVLKAAAGTYTLNYTTTTTPTYKSIDSNDLCGAATDITAAEMAAANPGENYFYALSLNAAGEASSVGFYWIAENGAAFAQDANKAYLVLPKLHGARAFVFNDDVATGIQSVNATANNSQAYNLAGQRVAANTKGIVIINGKKYIVK